MKQAVILSTLVALVSLVGAPTFAKGNKDPKGTCVTTNADGSKSEAKNVKQSACTGEFTANAAKTKKK
jgi:hypothetical protein